MTSPASDIASYLAGVSGLGLTLGTNLFVSRHPDSPDLCVAVLDSMAEPGDGRLEIEAPRVQIRMRGKASDYVEMYDLANAIQQALDCKHDIIIGDTRYIGIWLLVGFTQLGRDERDRPLGSINFRMERTPAS